jgi:replicative DNA helicase
LENHGQLTQAGGLPYLAILARDTPSTTNLDRYAEIVREKATLRELLTVAAELQQQTLKPEGKSAAELLELMQTRLLTIKASNLIDAPEPITLGLSRVLNILDERSRGILPPGHPTGFTEIDRLTGGLEPGSLTVLAGRPGMGKSTLAGNIALNMASEEQAVLLFSLEMSRDQLILRFLSAEANIGHDKLRWGNFDDADWPRLMAAQSKLAGKRIFLDEGSLTIRQLQIRARQLHRRTPLRLIVVDYLQLVQGEGQNRTQEIASVSRGLKALAKELGVPVLAVSQLNREVERRDNKRPVLADLRDSGQIEQDADTVVFVYRDEVYHDDSADRGCAEVIIAKGRNHPTGTVSLAFRGGFASFGNLAGSLPSSQTPSEWNGSKTSVFSACRQAH